MSVGREISIKDMTKITKKLLNNSSYEDFYSILVLSLMTVSKFSKQKIHLKVQNKIDLTIEYLPDLIEFLLLKKHITQNQAERLNLEIEKKKLELPIILKSYIFMLSDQNLSTKNLKDKKFCKIS